MIREREEIKNLIEKLLKALQKEKKLPKFDIPEIQIEHPEEKVRGDYAANIAMVVARQIKKSPGEIAKLLREKLKAQNLKLFEKIEVAKPGFVNFSLSKEYLQKQVGLILKSGKDFGQLKDDRKQKANIEFISANPTGPLHVGNGRGAFFGDTLANVLEKAGYKVTREYYVNDAKESNQIKELGKTVLGKGITYLTGELKNQILKLKTKTQVSKLSESEAGSLLAQEVQKDNKSFIEKKLKIRFDNWISEEDLYKKSKVKKIYNWLKNKNLIYKKQGAEWLKTSKFGDKKDWVVIRAPIAKFGGEGQVIGEPTYLLPDIAYHKDKFDRKFNKIINIWGADHQGHVSKIKAASKILGFKGDLDILISQVVRLKKGKISKRKGEIITLERLINEVGLDAARFLYLMKSLDTQMEFNVELAKERSEKSSVYYIQYAHARICAILRKAEKSKTLSTKFQINSKLKVQNSKLRLLNHPSELALIKQLIRFPEIVEDTAKDYQVQRIPLYAIDSATVFHQFYRDCRVLSSDKKLTKDRLALILATKTVFKNTLGLMGISAPEKM